MADGGEGTVQAMIEATHGRRVEVEVTAPLGQRVPSFYALTGDGHTAVIEMAAASGLALVPADQRDPLVTTSYGTGELIAAALDAGARHLIVGIGGSATNDGGAGMLQALGVKLLDAQGQPIGRGGAPLAQLARIDASGLDARLAACTIEVACDVDNPLTGARGASAIFGPQKGATPAMVQTLDANLQHFAQLIERDCGRRGGARLQVPVPQVAWVRQCWLFSKASCAPAAKSLPRPWAWKPPCKMQIWSSPARAALTSKPSSAKPRLA